MQLFTDLAQHRAFILARITVRPDGGIDKVPMDPRTGYNVDPLDPAAWMTPQDALAWCNYWGRGHGVGLVLYEGCGLAFLDMDKCRLDSGGWKPHVASLEARFPWAYRETSISLRGRHLIFRVQGDIPKHRTRNGGLGLELYTRNRFALLTGIDGNGFVLSDGTAEFHKLLSELFPGVDGEDPAVAGWTREAVQGWRGPANDDELISRAVRSQTPRATLGAGASFAALWTCNQDVLARSFPSQSTGKAWDYSAADQALANHLAFWTGNNCERMRRLMLASGLRRAKYEREDYLPRTILRACVGQRQWYTGAGDAVVTVFEVPDPPGAGGVSENPTAAGGNVPEPPTRAAAGQRAMPGDVVHLPLMLQMFEGWTYVRDIHKMQVQDGSVMTKEQVDAEHGGPLFFINREMTKTTKSAWDAIVLSPFHQFPKVQTRYFAPREPLGNVRVVRDDWREINCYQKPDIQEADGDPAPFMDLLARMYPHEGDRAILLAYMAAVVQNPGVKFTWCPFLQGTNGNGKTTVGRVLEYCMSPRYTHWAKADQISEKFNSVFVEKTLIVVDEMYAEDKLGFEEILKSMVTAERLEVRPMWGEKCMKEVCFNLLLISNHKNGLRIRPQERRYAPLYARQQYEGDCYRDGLTDEYFIALNDWLKGGGFAILARYLRTYAIPDALNPATSCKRAPRTSSSSESIVASMGPVEQEVLNEVKLQRDGFRGGWLSSAVLDGLIARMGKGRFMSRQARHELALNLGYAEVGVAPLADGQLAQVYVQRTHPWNVPGLPPATIRDAYLAAQKQTYQS